MTKTHNAAAVSKVLGVSVVTLLKWRARGIGPAWFKSGPRYYYKAEDLQEYLDRIGPLPKGSDHWKRRRFFQEAHGPEVIEEPVAEEPVAEHDATLAKTVADLKRRLEVIEVAVVLLGGQAHG
jgi:DNA-binding transcriptional MerR regulator